MRATIIQQLASRKGVLIAIGTILLAGAFIRLYNLGEQSYWMDEGYTVNAVLAIQETGTPILDSGYEYNCPVYCVPTAKIADALGNTPTSYRLLATLAGIVFIMAIFWITRSLFTTHIALLSTFFVSFSYIHIAWSRQARWYTLFTLFFWLALFFFYHARKTKKSKLIYYLLTALMTILACLTHRLGLLLPLILLIWAGIEYLHHGARHVSKRRVSEALIIGGLSVTVISFLSGYNPLLWLFNMADPQLNYPFYLLYYLRNYWFFIPFVALIWILPSTHRKPAVYLLLAFTAYLLPLSFLTESIQYRYMFHLTPIFYILGSAGLVALLTTLKHVKRQVLAVFLFVGIFFVSGLGTLTLRAQYYLESDPQESTFLHPPYYAYTPQPNWRDAYAYIKENIAETDVVITAQPPFNKIYLKQAGYWIEYPYLGTASSSMPINNGKEFYVGATVLSDISDVINLTQEQHGFLVLDHFARDGRIPDMTISYIENNLNLEYYEQTNEVSGIWVYRF